MSEVDWDLVVLAFNEASQIAEDLMQPSRLKLTRERIRAKSPALILPDQTVDFIAVRHAPSTRDWQRAAWKGLHYGGTLKKRPKNKKARRR